MSDTTYSKPIALPVGGMLPPWTDRMEDHHQRVLAHLRDCPVWTLNAACPGLEALFNEPTQRTTKATAP